MQQVNSRITELMEIVRQQEPEFARPIVTYYSNKQAAGQASYKGWEVRFNSVHLVENMESMLHETVAHEIAHLVVWHIWKFKGKPLPRPKPHGREWQRIMVQWFKVSPERQHNYSMANVNTKSQRRHAATCGCAGRTHQISTTRYHKIILKGQSYICNSCHTSLELT